MDFEWDDQKNLQNFSKHGISFEEAQEIFYGPTFTRIDDRWDYDELREITIGAIQGLVVIVVVHTDRGSITRIISARKATRRERRTYYGYLARET